MQKKLIAAAVAALCAVPAFAQSNVTIYGRVDMGYRTFTNDSRSNYLDEESSNRWGLMGEEDLGGGLKAFFQLENRFFLDTGVQNDRQWKDKAWVGLKHDKMGAIAFGRVHSAAYALYGGTYEAFGGDTIGVMPSRRGLVTNIWNNGINYQSPTFGGVFKLVASLGLPEDNDKTRWAVGGQLSLGAFKMDAVYQKDSTTDGTDAASSVMAAQAKDANGKLVFDANGAPVYEASKSMFKTWFVTAAYNFGVAEVFGGYTQSKGYEARGMGDDDRKMTVYQIGARMPVGAGTIMANAGQVKNDYGDYDTKRNHFAVGYWYNLSKRTILMANVSYDIEKAKRANPLTADPTKGAIETDSNGHHKGSIGTELAIRHTF